MHNKISHMEEKCHHEKLKQQIIKCLNCFPNSKIVQPFSASSAKAFGSLFCAGNRDLYLESCPRGWVLCSPWAFVLHFAANTFYQYAWNIWINLWIKMWIWFWLVNIPTNGNHLWLALAKGVHCQYQIFLARPQGFCALKEKNCKCLWQPRGVSGKGWPGG